SEVVVTFDAGDPDRPIVIGCLYNGANLPPHALPQHRTKTGIRTRSMPGGEGSNELWFEDASGREQIYLHAERDLDEVVGNNHALLVRQEQTIRILGDRLDAVEQSL